MMIGFLKNIKGMPAGQLAKAMIHNAKLSSKGVFIHSNKSIHDFFLLRNSLVIVLLFLVQNTYGQFEKISVRNTSIEYEKDFS